MQGPRWRACPRWPGTVLAPTGAGGVRHPGPARRPGARNPASPPGARRRDEALRPTRLSPMRQQVFTLDPASCAGVVGGPTWPTTCKCPLRRLWARCFLKENCSTTRIASSATWRKAAWARSTRPGTRAWRAATRSRCCRRSSRQIMLSRFRREAQIASGLQHPNVVQVIDFTRPTTVGVPGHGVPGRREPGALDEPPGPADARRALRSSSRSPRAGRRAPAGRRSPRHQAAKRLSVVAQPDGTPVKLLDFGISKGKVPWWGPKAPGGALMGTPQYMAPEQVAGGVGTSGRDGSVRPRRDPLRDADRS